MVKYRVYLYQPDIERVQIEEIYTFEERICVRTHMTHTHTKHRITNLPEMSKQFNRFYQPHSLRKKIS